MNTIMKKTYKYLIASVAFSAAALASGLNLNAQNLPAGVYLEQDGICFRKTATKQDNDASKYTIDLETFVKGKISYTESADPSDIVLVLDVSGSMDQNITYYNYNEASNPVIRGRDLYTYGGWYWYRETDYYYKVGEGTDAEYYQVYVGMDGSGNDLSDYHFFIYFQDSNGKRWHINSAGELVEVEPTNVPGTEYDTNLVNSNVTLYTRQQAGTKTKLTALKEAVRAFITEVAKNAKFDKKGQQRPTPLDHRIAIVKFAGYDADGIIYYNNNANAYEEAGTGNNKGNHRASDGTNYNEVVRGLKSVLTDSTDLKNAVNGLVAGGATASDHGMQLAKNIINHISAERTSNKTVVFFTDGEPNHYRDFDSDVADDAINNSHSIKTITYGSGDDATHPTVFSVGVFASSPKPEDDIYIYMDRISSDYPDATSMTNTCSKESSDFYKDASGGAADLTAIFKAIAGSASQQGSTIGSSSAVTVDVVSSSFNLPANAQDAELEILVAPCTGTTKISYEGKVNDYLTFGEAKAPSEYGLPAITYNIDQSKNEISTSGFDFSTNFCGPDESGTTTTYRGYKQIIRFTITVRDDAVGGPDVATNDKKSGIYVDGNQIAEFNRPRVKLPVQIWIQKTGLVGDDSAVFTLYCSPFKGFDTEHPENNPWTTFSKVIVNNENMVEIDDPKHPGKKIKVRKLVGLDPDYYYKLKEDAWAFGYQYQDGDGIVYTVGDDISNPIEIKNTPKDIHFDEAVVRNEFKEKNSSSSGNR